jgi:hypothetical protein
LAGEKGFADDLDSAAPSSDPRTVRSKGRAASGTLCAQSRTTERRRPAKRVLGTTPVLGVEVTADFTFDVPVRFDTDHMAVTIETYQLHSWQQIPIVELRS